MRCLKFTLSICWCGDPPKRPKVLFANFKRLENGMAQCTLTFSPASVPPGSSPVTQRTLYVTDGTGASFTILLDGDVTQTQPGDIPDLNVSHEAPGSCYLVDNNAGGDPSGDSAPSPAFVLDPGVVPPPVNVPNQPTILAAQWMDQFQMRAAASGDQVIDKRRRR